MHFACMCGHKSCTTRWNWAMLELVITHRFVAWFHRAASTMQRRAMHLHTSSRTEDSVMFVWPTVPQPPQVRIGVRGFFHRAASPQRRTKCRLSLVHFFNFSFFFDFFIFHFFNFYIFSSFSSVSSVSSFIFFEFCFVFPFFHFFLLSFSHFLIFFFLLFFLHFAFLTF